jgi:plastocyanin
MVMALMLICWACAGDDTAGTTVPTDTAAPAATSVPETPETTAAEATTTTAGSSQPAATITISGFSFGDPVTVQVGDTVAVVNNDGVPHTWTSEDDLFNLSLSGGAQGTFTFEEPGEYAFFCTIHPSMTGTITVEG